MRSASSSPSLSAARSRAWSRGSWWTACVLVLCAISWPARTHALTPSESGLLQSTLAELQRAKLDLATLNALLPELKQNATALSERLEQARRQLSMLDAALQLWQENSAELETALQGLSSELATLRRSLSALKLELNAQSRAFSDYRSAADRVVRSRDTWRTVAVAGTLAALAAGFLAGALAR